MKNQILKIASISLLTSSFLLGVDVPNIGDIEKQIKTPKIEQEKTTLPEINIPKEYKAPMKDSGKTILVKSFIFSGNDHITSESLQKYTKAYENKELTFKQITQLTSIITKYYRLNGYFVARAYLPVQNIQENANVLEIAIIEGTYGEFKLNNSSLVKDSVLQGMLDNAKARDNVVSNNTLERSMLIINDTTGAMVTSADVRPGRAVGSSDFTITTQPTKRVDGYVVADNTGSRYTGKNRLMAGLNINSPFEIGDKIAFSGLVSNGADLTNGRVAYSAPLTPSGLIGELAYSQTSYSLVKLGTISNGDYTGTAKTIEASLKYPLIRTRAENLYLNMKVDSKDLESTYDKVEKKDSKSITVGTDYDKSYMVNEHNSSSKISFNVKYGNLSFDDTADKTTDKAGADTNGNYSKVNLDISNTIAFTNELSLDTSLLLQYALGNKNLDGSEDISIGGSNGVKLYPDGEVSAENGYVFNAELKYKLPQLNSLNSTVGVFYDRGRAFMADNSQGTFEAKSLQDVGVGYYASYDKFFGQVQVAWNANSKDVTSEPNRNSRVLFQGGLVF